MQIDAPGSDLPYRRMVRSVIWISIIYAVCQLLYPALGRTSYPGWNPSGMRYSVFLAPILFLAGWVAHLLLLIGALLALSFRPAGRKLLLVYAYSMATIFALGLLDVLLSPPLLNGLSFSRGSDPAVFITYVLPPLIFRLLGAPQTLLLPALLFVVLRPARELFELRPADTAFPVVLTNDRQV